MKIGTIMTRDVVTCPVDATMAQAARIMWDRDCGCVPVVGTDGHLVGIITDRDLCMAALTRDLPLTRMAVREAMRREPHACTAEDDVGRAHRIMRERQVRRLPVVDRTGHVAGIVSLNDLALAAGEDGQARRQAEIVKTLAAICRHREPVPA